MTLPVYPDRTVLPGLGFSTKWSPVFFNMPTQTAAAGADIDLALAATPLHDFELTYEVLRDAGRNTLEASEFRTMMGFHLQLGGTVGRFFFKNIDDFSVSQQLIGVGDGVTTAFVLTRTYGLGGYSGTEPVGGVNTAYPFNVYLGDSATPADPSSYTLSTTMPCQQIVTFGVAPLLGQNVRVDMNYWYYCKLADNSNTFEKFMNRLWLLNKVKLHSCRAGA